MIDLDEHKYRVSNVYLWTLLVDDTCPPDGSGGCKVMQTPSYHATNEGIIREVEHRWKTKVLAIRGCEELYLREERGSAV